MVTSLLSIDLQALDEILSEGYNVVALMEDRHLDGLGHLEDRGFKTWVWSENDLRQLELANATDTFDQKNYHFMITIVPFRISIQDSLKK